MKLLLPIVSIILHKNLEKEYKEINGTIWPYNNKLILQPNPESEESKNVRAFWIYCVLFDFFDSSKGKTINVLKNIAQFIPVIISEKSYYWNQIQIEIDSYLASPLFLPVRVFFLVFV